MSKIKIPTMGMREIAAREPMFSLMDMPGHYLEEREEQAILEANRQRDRQIREQQQRPLNILEML